MFDETLTGGGKSKQPAAGAPRITLVISHSGPEVRITKKIVSDGVEQTREFVYYDDGRGETNPGPTFSFSHLGDASKKIKSRTEWKRGKLRTSSTIQLAAAGGFHDVNLTDEWKLSADGRTLTKTTSVRGDDVASRGRRSMPTFLFFDRDTKMVFRRLPD